MTTRKSRTHDESEVERLARVEEQMQHTNEKVDQLQKSTESGFRRLEENIRGLEVSIKNTVLSPKMESTIEAIREQQIRHDEWRKLVDRKLDTAAAEVGHIKRYITLAIGGGLVLLFVLEKLWPTLVALLA